MINTGKQRVQAKKSHIRIRELKKSHIRIRELPDSRLGYDLTPTPTLPPDSTLTPDPTLILTSSTSTDAPSPMTKPSRALSNGLLDVKSRSYGEG